MKMDERKEELSYPEISTRCSSSHNHPAQGMDVSYCWLPRDNMQFIPHFQSMYLPHLDKVNSPEAHGCPISKDHRRLQPIIGCSFDFFAQRQKCCTCPQHIKQLEAAREHKVQPIPSEGPNFTSTSLNRCIFLPACVGTEAKPSECPNVLSAHSSYFDNLIMKSSNGEQTNTEDENLLKLNCEKPDNPGVSRIRGKRLLCPKNATPLYGKTPSWWGDSSSDSPPSSDHPKAKVINRPTIPGSKLSSNSDEQGPSDILQLEALGTDKELRRQSTAFVVNLDSSEQSAQMPLSSSLPSFQINDHLCSYFPVSRKMSLQRREASVRRKQSLEATDRNLISDVASEHGTYVVDLDLDDDVIEDESPQVAFSHQETDKVERKCSPLKDTSCQVRDFDEIRLGEDKTTGNKEDKETKKNPKKVSRKKTFVVSSEDLEDPTIVKTQDKISDLQANSVDKIGKFASGINDKNISTKPTLEKANNLGNSLDTRQLSKESSWNFVNSGNVLENMEYTASVMKLDSPKILSKPTFENKTKDSGCNRLDNEEFQGDFSQFSDVAPGSIDQKSDHFKLNDTDPTYNPIQNLDEDNFNLLTGRSIKTELLLKPTEEISLHLKQSRSYSHLDNKKSHDYKDFSLNDLVKGKDGSGISSCESIDSIESLDSKSIEIIKPPNFSDSTCKFETRYNARNDTNDPIKGTRYDSNCIYNPKTIPIGFEESDSIRKRYQSSITPGTDSSVEDCQSNFTDLSLGQQIVKKCRSNSSASTAKSRGSFIPPHKKQTYSSIQKLVSNGSPTSSDKSAHKTLHNKQPKTPDIQSKGLKQNSPRSSIRGRSSTELSVKGRSFSRTATGRELDWQQKDRAKQKVESIKMERVNDDISSLTAIMKYSAQIQLLAGNLLELINLRNEKKDMWKSAERHVVDTTVSSRLSTMLSTMKASNDLLFDLHDFLIAGMDQI